MQQSAVGLREWLTWKVVWVAVFGGMLTSIDEIFLRWLTTDLVQKLRIRRGERVASTYSVWSALSTALHSERKTLLVLSTTHVAESLQLPSNNIHTKKGAKVWYTYVWCLLYITRH